MGSRASLPSPSRSKYRAVATNVDGIRFHSKREAARYRELRLLEKAGHVRDILRQQRLVLHASLAGNCEPVTIGAYVVDFVYERKQGATWVAVVEEVKGFDYPLGKWKRKHAEAEYGIAIEVVK